LVLVHHYKHCVRYHLEGLPQGKAGEQSVKPADELSGRGDAGRMYRRALASLGDGAAFEFHGYGGLSNHFATTADDAIAQQMYQDSLSCLWEWLGVE